MVATHAIDEGEWTEIPNNQLFVYKNGECVYTGQKHPFTYIENEEQTKLLYLGYAEL